MCKYRVNQRLIVLNLQSVSINKILFKEFFTVKVSQNINWLCIKRGIQNGERDAGNGGMLYSGECPQTFWGMSPNIAGNVPKHSRECPQKFRGMSPNIPGNVLKYSWECRQTFQGMSQNILGSVAKLLPLISECFTVRYVLISSNQSEYLYSFPVCKNVLLANPKETSQSQLSRIIVVEPFQRQSFWFSANLVFARANENLINFRQII